jgi:predicted nucleic acid-binding protein
VTDFVLDNSVTMRWCFDSGSHPYADAIIHRLGTGQEKAFVPILWRYEVSAVLTRAHRTGALLATKMQGFLASLEALPIIIDAHSGDCVLSDVHQRAITFGLTSYDAAYLELAQRLNLPLATLDAELVTACKAAGVAVL